MGCAPSKQNAEQENDPEKRPLSGKEKKSPKGRKSPKKDRAAAKEDKIDKENTKNNNAKDGPIIAETVLKTESEPVTTAAAPPSERNGSTPVDQTDAQVHNQVANKGPESPSSPIKEIAEKYGELWDLTRGMPPPTSPYDDGHSPPPKPERMHHHTFPRSRQKQRSLSDREEKLESSTLERKISLRERTPDRRKDLDVSGNIYLGKSIEPPGRGRKIDAERLDFLNIEGSPDEKDVVLPKLSVKERAQTYLESVKKMEERKSTTSPIRRPVRKLVEEDSGEESHTISPDGNISIIEAVNKEILEDYHEVEKKTFEEIEKEMMERAAEEAEKERIRQEEEGKKRAEEAERERIRQEEEEERKRVEEAEQERIRKEEEERKQAEEAEQERIRQEEEIAPERQSEMSTIPETEGGDIDPSDKGAQLEDRFYNNKAFEKPDIDSSNPEQQDAALKIQTKYRQHHAKEVVSQKRQEQAAVKIQAGYRGWHDRKRVTELKTHVDAKSEADAQKAHEDDTRGDTLNYDNPEVVNAATTIQAGFKGYKARKQVQELKDGQATSLAEPESAAQDNAEPTAQDDTKPSELVDAPEPADNADSSLQKDGDEVKDSKAINYDDPDVEKAATKIQAGLRGMQARKKVKELKQVQNDGKDENKENQDGEGDAPDDVTGEETAPGETTNSAEFDFDPNDPEVNKAASKIQAGFKGYKTRKEMGDKLKHDGDGEEQSAEAEKPAE